MLDTRILIITSVLIVLIIFLIYRSSQRNYTIKRINVPIYGGDAHRSALLHDWWTPPRLSDDTRGGVINMDTAFADKRNKAINRARSFINKKQKNKNKHRSRVYNATPAVTIEDNGIQHTIPRQPSVRTEIEYHLDRVQNGEEEALLSVGDLYAFGLHGDDSFVPSFNRARIVYVRLLMSTKDAKLKADARERLDNLALQERGRSSLNQSRAGQHNGNNTTIMAPPTSTNNAITTDNQQQIVPNTTNVSNNDPAPTPVVLEEPVQHAIVLATPINDDRQNVHDSSVVVSIRNVIKYLENTRGADCVNKETAVMRNELCEYLSRNKMQTREERAKNDLIISIFDRIVNESAMIVAFGYTHVGALQLVWDIAPMENKAYQLHSCYENGMIVCMMGRFNRIIDMVTGIEGVPPIRTKEMLRREILEYAAMSRKHFDDRLAEENREEGDGEFKALLTEELYNIYIQPQQGEALISKEALDAELSGWIDFI